MNNATPAHVYAATILLGMLLVALFYEPVSTPDTALIPCVPAVETPLQQRRTTYPNYKVYIPPTTDKLDGVKVELRTDAEVRIICWGAAGCYDPPTKRVIVPAPKDFNDGLGLMILGHEVLHALGAYHD